MSLPKNLAAAALCPLAYLIVCALFAATAAYPIFILTGSDSAGFFRVLISRGGQVFLLLGLFVISKRLGLSAASLGFQRAFPRQWAMGFALGLLMLGLHVLGLVALDIRGLKESEFQETGRLLGILGKSLATGAIVALLEELIFRGVLFAAVRKFSGAATAVVTSAFYYAIVHFLRSDWTGYPADIGWDTGLRIAADGFAHLAAMPLDSFLALFAAGVFLGAVRAAIPRSLGLCMGLHAGWVFVIKAAKPLTYLDPEARWSFLAGGYDHIIGYLSAGWLTVLILALLAAVRHRAARKPGVFR
jgi:membrane protease YdiL (CAAX protease family)